MKKSTAETIAYAIKKECQRSSLCDWCDSWDITTDEFEEFLALAVDNAETASGSMAVARYSLVVDRTERR